MSLSDDDLDAVTRRQRTSLDAQRFTFMPRQPAMASPSAATPSGSSSTFLLPILLPATSVASTDIETSPVILKELSAKPDGRSSSSGAAVLPPEIANADLAIAVDRSFIETSSGFAARQLKKFYERMGGEIGPGRGPRLPYVITSLTVNGKQRYRVSLRQDGDLSSEIVHTESGRPSSIIPSIGGIINSVIAREGARNSHPGGQRQILRRPRSISEPRESNVYSSGPPAGIVGGFVNPFASSSRRSLDHRRPSTSDATQGQASHPYPSHSNNDASPFGPGVVYTEPSVPSSPQAASFPVQGLREMQSFESGLTARADEASSARHHPASQFLVKEPLLNHASMSTTPYSTLVFDVLQTYRGAPLPDRLSESSNEPTVKLSTTVKAVPSDDPRFVIWGEVYPDRPDEMASSQDSHTDLSIGSQSGVSPRRKTSHARSTDVPSSLTQPPEKVIVAATIERWIAQLTSENESLELLYFFLTYRIYISGVDLCHLLICRFHWALERPVSNHDKTVRALVRVRTYKMIRHWLLMWFKVDFATNPHLCQVLTHWVNTLRKDPALSKLPDALDLVRRIKKLIRECKEEAERVKPTNGEEKPSSSHGSREDAETDGLGRRHPNSPFHESIVKPMRGTALDIPPAGQTLTPVLGAAFAVSGSVEFPGPPAILSSTQVMSGTPHSSTPAVLNQPLHMAILAQAKTPLLPTHVHTPPAPVPMSGTLPMQHSAISRVLVNTMGKLGRWKRVLNARSTPVPSQLDCSGASSFDIEQINAGDLQYGNHVQARHNLLHATTASISDTSFATPLYDHLNDHAESQSKASSHLSTLDESTESDPGAKTPQPSLILPRAQTASTGDVGPTQNVEQDQVEPSLRTTPTTEDAAGDDGSLSTTGLVSEGQAPTCADITCTPSTDAAQQLSPSLSERPQSNSLHSSLSMETSTLEGSIIRERPIEPVGSYGTTAGSPSASLQGESRHQSVASSNFNQRNSFWDSSEEDYGEPISGNAAWFSSRGPDNQEFVEYDSSDDQSSISHTRKPPRRLPHGRELQFVTRVDSMSTYDTASASRSSLATEEGEAPATNQPRDPNSGRVYKWQLEYIESDEEEAQDAEAALRRLEGFIDRERQRRKETKIDGWLKQVEERKARGLVRDEVTDDDGTDLQSSRDDPEDEARLTTPPDESPVEDTQIEEPLALPMERRAAEQELETAANSIGRDSAGPMPDSMDHSHSYPQLQHLEEVYTVPDENLVGSQAPEAALAYRSHKHSLSLSHRQSAFKIGEQRYQPPTSTPMREPWILLNRSSKVAQHLTMIESDLWRNVPFEDLVGSSAAIDPDTKLDVPDWGEFMKQRARLRGGSAPNASRPFNDLLIVRARFQLTVMFTASEILLTRPNLRPLLVSKFIRIALKCYTLNNFSSLVAIVTGLGLPPVQAVLHRMPKKIGSYESRILDSLKSFCSAEGNYRLIREAVSNLILANKSTDPLVPQSATAVTDSSRACIPHIGIYLSQLYKYDRLPDYVDPTAPTEPVDEEPNGTLTQPKHPDVFTNLAPLPPSMTLEPLINVHKQRLISNVVISFMNAQQLTNKYKFVTERKLHQRCIKLRAFDMVTLHQLSQAEQ